MDDKPPMPDNLRELAIAAKGRAQKRGACAPLEEMIPARGDDRAWFDCPYAPEDWELWICLLLDTFGTRKIGVVNAFMAKLVGMVGEEWDSEKQRHFVNYDKLQLALSIICSLKPRDEAQAVIAVHCVALHLLTYKVTERMTSHSWLDLKSTTALAKVVKAYSNEVRALRDLQSPNKPKRQVITVKKELHQHVHYHTGHSGEGGRDSGNRSHASDAQRARATPARSLPECPALPCPDQGGDVVSFARREGEEAVPDARIGRRTEG